MFRIIKHKIILYKIKYNVNMSYQQRHESQEMKVIQQSTYKDIALDNEESTVHITQGQGFGLMVEKKAIPEIIKALQDFISQPVSK